MRITAHMRDWPTTAVWRMLIATLILGVAACSTSDYDAPIQAFKSATDAAATSTGKVNTSLAEATLNYAVKSAARDPANNHLKREAKDCGAYNPATEVRCRAYFELRSADGEHSVTLRRDDYSDPLRGMVGILEAAQTYATNLLAVEQANTAEQVNNSVDSIQASLVQIVKAANPKAEFNDQIPQAAGEAVKWAFGQYIESVKFDALRKATSAARSPLALAQVVFKDMEQSAKIALTSSAMEAASDSIQKMNPHNESDIRTTLAAQNAYDDLLTAPLSSMFDNLVGAHESLAKALEGGSHLSLREALGKLDDIEKQAQTLAKIATDLHDALKK